MKGYSRVCCIGTSLLAATSILCSVSSLAAEVCGLQDANFDTIYFDGFGPPATGGGLGPALGTADAPTLGIAPTVAITHPAPGAVLPAGRVQIAGTVSGSINTGVSVGGIRAYVQDGVFLTPEFTLDEAATGLEVQATTLDGLTTQAGVAISVSAADVQARLAPDAPVGFAPLPVRFELTLADGLELAAVSVDFDGDGVPDHVGTSAGYLPLYTYEQPGIYAATATITLDDNQQRSASFRVIALDFADQRSQVCAVYAHLRARLAAQDADGARQALMGALRARLGPFFDALGTDMPTVAAQLGVLADGLIGLDAADIVSVREVDGQLRAYPVHFARGADGVWRIDSM